MLSCFPSQQPEGVRSSKIRKIVLQSEKEILVTHIFEKTENNESNLTEHRLPEEVATGREREKEGARDLQNSNRKYATRMINVSP